VRAHGHGQNAECGCRPPVTEDPAIPGASAGAGSVTPASTSVLARLAANIAETFPAETARRLACDAGLVTVLHNPDGSVLDIGRKSRTVPPALRRALEIRDGGCRFPGCGCRHTDAHHIDPWENGGETKLSNLASLCRRHHRLVHEGGFRVEMDEASGEVRFYRPDGRLIPEVPWAPVLPAEPTESLVAEHEAEGIEPGAWTPTPDWHGEPLDMPWAIDVMWRPKGTERAEEGVGRGRE